MSYRMKLKAGLLSATIFSSVALATPALADDAADASFDGGDIIVSATRRNTTLIETPINISAIGTDELSHERITDMREDRKSVGEGKSVTERGKLGGGSNK